MHKVTNKKTCLEQRAHIHLCSIHWGGGKTACIIPATEGENEKEERACEGERESNRRERRAMRNRADSEAVVSCHCLKSNDPWVLFKE